MVDALGGTPHAGDPPVGYRHVAHLGRADATAAQQVLPMLQAGVDRGDPLLLACSAPLASYLSAGLPPGAAVVVDDAVIGGRTPTALAGYTALLDAHAPGPGQRLQLVTDSTRHCTGMTAWLQTEALLNHVLADRALDHLCLVDEAGLAEDAALARATHRLLLRGSSVVANPFWREPADVLRDLGTVPGPDPLEAGRPTLAVDDVEDMRSLRRQLNQALRGGPLSADDTEDLVLAIDEVTANAAEHGVPPVDVRLWVTPERVLCSITDRGSGFDEPLAGYGPAHGTDLSVGGMGLWLARRAVDRMTTGPLSPDGSGCVVRLLIDPRAR